MSYQQGENLRSTSPFVTDISPDEFEGGGTAYPRTTAQGNSVGYEVGSTSATLQTRNRNSGNDARLAGKHDDGSAVLKYRFDLPSAGTYNIRFAGGDSNYASDVATDLYDNTTLLTTLASGNTGAANSFFDAANGVLTAANWVTNNRFLSKTFSSTICRFQAQAINKTWTHLYVEAGNIAPDADSNSTYQAASSSYSWNHTCTGSNRYLVVGVSMLSLAQTVTALTYNGVAMTFLGAQNSVSGAARVEMWGLIAPSTGSNTIAVTLSGSIASEANATSFTGVDQTTPTEGFNSAQATNVGAADATVNVTVSTTQAFVIDQVATDDTAITVGAKQISRNNVTGAGGSGASSTEGPSAPATVTMSWTNVAALATWSIAAVALRPVQSVSAGPAFASHQFFAF